MLFSKTTGKPGRNKTRGDRGREHGKGKEKEEGGKEWIDKGKLDEETYNKFAVPGKV